MALLKFFPFTCIVRNSQYSGIGVGAGMDGHHGNILEARPVQCSYTCIYYYNFVTVSSVLKLMEIKPGVL